MPLSSESWTNNLSYTSMAEETRNPSRTVPRVLWTTSIFHYINVYITVIMFMVIIIPVSNGMGASFPVVSPQHIPYELHA